MEIKDIYDKFRRPTGKTALRGSTQGVDDYTLAVRIWLVDERGQMLLQQRQQTKARWPSLWDCAVAGGVLQGETTAQAALRECHEELGLALQAQDLTPLFTAMDGNRFDDLFLVRKNPDLHALTLQKEEVAAVQWADKCMVWALLAAGEFVPYSFFDELFAVLRSDVVFEGYPCGTVWHGGVRQAAVCTEQDGQGQLAVALTLFQRDCLRSILLRIEAMHPEAALCELALSGLGVDTDAEAACADLGYQQYAPNRWRKHCGLHKIHQQIRL